MILFNKSINRFESVKIAENIHEGVVEHFCEKFTIVEANRTSYRRSNKCRSDPSKSKPDMGRSGKCKKCYTRHQISKSQLTYLIHAPDNSPEKCKVVSDFW